MERLYYSPTFKRQVLAFYNEHREAGWTAARVARKFKMNANTLRAWIADRPTMFSRVHEITVTGNLTDDAEAAIRSLLRNRPSDIEIGLLNIENSVAFIRKSLHDK